jgi:phospholipid transport system substrate-binding protein
MAGMAAALAFLPVLAVLAPGSACAQDAAQVFIQQDADKTLAILKNSSAGDEDRAAKIRDLMSSLLDLKRMAMFTLGPAARTASPADIEAFVAAYKEFALANYSSELSGYMGQSLRITGSTQRAPGDYVVNAVVTDPAHRGDPPVSVSFRVLDEGGGKLALVDASVEGVWFTLAQRDDFTGFLGQNNGDVTKLIAHLKDLAAHPKSATATPR